jgi:hypothetical protein
MFDRILFADLLLSCTLKRQQERNNHFTTKVISTPRIHPSEHAVYNFRYHPLMQLSASLAAGRLSVVNGRHGELALRPSGVTALRHTRQEPGTVRGQHC